MIVAVHAIERSKHELGSIMPKMGVPLYLRTIECNASIELAQITR